MSDKHAKFRCVCGMAFGSYCGLATHVVCPPESKTVEDRSRCGYPVVCTCKTCHLCSRAKSEGCGCVDEKRQKWLKKPVAWRRTRPNTPHSRFTYRVLLEIPQLNEEVKCIIYLKDPIGLHIAIYDGPATNTWVDVTDRWYDDYALTAKAVGMGRPDRIIIEYKWKSNLCWRVSEGII